MFDEELDPKTKKPKPRNLSQMSISELQDYIADLRAEIIRVEADIEKKKSSQAAAAAFFKS